MTSKTNDKLAPSLKANIARGYGLYHAKEKELTKTQRWIIDKLMDEEGDKEYGGYHELTRFLTDLNLAIKVPMLTELKPYTNKRGKTTMKHYTANGVLVNHLKSKVPVMFPTWTNFDREKFQINEGGEFKSFETQTVYMMKDTDGCSRYEL
tara:strand:+ start:75 stop:527 length:453 start_codon:yes stop_codon:yes gene_type:complete